MLVCKVLSILRLHLGGVVPAAEALVEAVRWKAWDMAAAQPAPLYSQPAAAASQLFNITLLLAHAFC